MQSGAPTFGTPEATLAIFGLAALARRLGVPFRSGGALTASKLPDAQAAYESANTLLPTVLAGTNFVLHGAGWLEGGLASGYEKFVMDADQLGMMQVLAAGYDLSANGQAMDAIREVGPGSHYLGCAHTQANFRDRILPLRRRRQFELRAVAGRRRQGHDAAGARAVQGDAGRLRSAAHRPRRRRGASRRSSRRRRPRCRTPSPRRVLGAGPVLDAPATFQARATRDHGAVHGARLLRQARAMRREREGGGAKVREGAHRPGRLPAVAAPGHFGSLRVRCESALGRYIPLYPAVSR